MDSNNWRPTQGGDPGGDAGDWRSQLQPDSRHRIVNKMYDFLLLSCILLCFYVYLTNNAENPDSNNWRPTQGGDPGGDAGDWRSQLQPDSRHRIVNKIMETLKRHLPVSGQKGLDELREIAVRFEKKVYTASTSQSDYLRKISLKMLTMETKPQSTALPSYSIVPTNEPIDSSKSSTDNLQPDSNNWGPTEGGEPRVDAGDWRSQLQPDFRDQIVNKIMETLKRHVPVSGHEGLDELTKIAVRFEEKVYTDSTRQSDYLRKISLKMFFMETNSPPSMSGPMTSNQP